MGNLLKKRLTHIAPWMKGRLGVALHLPKKPQRVLSDFEILHPKIEYIVDNSPNLDRLPEYHHFPENKLSGAHGIVDNRHKEINLSTELRDIHSPSVGAVAPLSIDSVNTIGIMLTQVGLNANKSLVDQENSLVTAAAPEQNDENDNNTLTRRDRDTFMHDDVLKFVK